MGSVAKAWNPWAALRGRTNVVLRFDEVAAEGGGGLYAYWPDRDRALIVLHPALSRQDRNAALAHELIHDERGGGAHQEGMPAAWAAVVARDEAIVDAEVARRLVDPDELMEFVTGRLSIGDAVDARAVADWFDVPVAVANRAVRQLAGRQ